MAWQTGWVTRHTRQTSSPARQLDELRSGELDLLYSSGHDPHQDTPDNSRFTPKADYAEYFWVSRELRVGDNITLQSERSNGK